MIKQNGRRITGVGKYAPGELEAPTVFRGMYMSYVQ